MDVHQIQLDRSIQEAISELDSLLGSESAVEKLVGFGRLAISHLEHVLLDCPARMTSIPRCRAVRTLGELGAYSILSKYFSRHERPADSAILFAKDKVSRLSSGTVLHVAWSILPC
jgi:hypothetical protein